MSTFTSGLTSVALVLIFIVAASGVVYFAAILASILLERAMQAHMRGMDRVHAFDKWCHQNGQPCRFCGRAYVCDEGCSRLDKWHAGEAS